MVTVAGVVVVVNGSIVSYTTVAFAALTQATDRTIEEINVVLRI